MNATVISILIRTPVQCAKSLEEDACMAPNVCVAKSILVEYYRKKYKMHVGKRESTDNIKSMV